jgi:hypothetical protein
MISYCTYTDDIHEQSRVLHSDQLDCVDGGAGPDDFVIEVTASNERLRRTVGPVNHFLFGLFSV